MGGLGVFGIPAVGGEEAGVEAGRDRTGLAGVALGVVGLAQDAGIFGQERGEEGEAGGGSEGHRGDAGVAFEPVAEVPGDHVILGRRGQEIDVAFHRFVGAFEELAIAAIIVEMVDGDGEGGAPPGVVAVFELAGGGLEAPAVGGQDGGDVAVGLLAVKHVLNVFGVEGGGVEVEEVGFHGVLGVLVPAHFFTGGLFAGHAVGGVEEGAAKGVVELVEAGVGAGEGAGRGEVGADPAGGDGFRGEFFAEAGELDVTETVISEAGLEGFAAAAGKDELFALVAPVSVGGAVGGVEGAVGAEGFVIVEGDFLARAAGGFEAHPAGGVAAEVDEDQARLGFSDLDRGEMVGDAHGGNLLGGKAAERGSRRSGRSARRGRRIWA